MPTATGSIAYLGAARFQGFWNASTNEATGSGLTGADSLLFGGDGVVNELFTTGSSIGGGYAKIGVVGASGHDLTASAGDYWQVTASGEHNVDGTTSWRVNDWVIYSGSAGAAAGTWVKMAFEDTIASVIAGDLSASDIFHLEASTDKHVLFVSGTTADTVRMSGSADFIVDYNTGRVGIGGELGSGTDLNPMNTLQVAHTGGDGDDGILIVRSDTSTADTNLLGGIGFDSTDGNVPSTITEASAYIAAYAAEAHGSGDKGGDLAFGTTTINDNADTTSHEWVRILDSGKVGIGTTAPAAKLDVSGSTIFGRDDGVTTTHQFSGSIYVADDKKLVFGQNDDAALEYNENGDNYLVISGSTNGLVLSGSNVLVDGLVQGTTLANGPGILLLSEVSGTNAYFDNNAFVFGNLGVTGSLTVGASGAGADVTFYGENASAIGLFWDADWEEHGGLILGTNDDGVDLIVYGETSNNYMYWDQSADTLSVAGELNVTGSTIFGSDDGVTTTHQLSGTMYVADDKKIVFGQHDDAHIEYDEDQSNLFIISGSLAGMVLSASTITLDGAVHTDSYIFHKDDLDTYIAFALEDNIMFSAGADIFMWYRGGVYTQDDLLIGPDGGTFFHTDVYLVDDKRLYFGSASVPSDPGESYIEYDEFRSNYMIVSGSTNGIVLSGSNILIDGLIQGTTLATNTGPLLLSEISGTTAYFGNNAFVYGSLNVTGSTSLSGSTVFGRNDGVTTTHQFSGSVYVADDKKVVFGENDDAHIEYDEDQTNYLIISGSTAGAVLSGSTVKVDTALFDIQSNTVEIGTDDDLDTTLRFKAASNDGYIYWQEDENYFGFASDIAMASNNKVWFGANSESHIEFNDNGDDYLVISGSTKGIVLSGSSIVIDGALEGASPLIISSSAADNATSLIISGTMQVSGALGLSGDLTGISSLSGSGAVYGDSFTANAKAYLNSAGIISGSGVSTIYGVTTDALIAQTADINGGSVDGATIGAAAQSSVKATTLSGSSTLNVAGASTFGPASYASISAAGVISGSGDSTIHKATMNQLVAGTADINGGSVDGATIGAAAQSSVKATTLSGSSALNVAGASTFGPANYASISAAGVISGSAAASLYGLSTYSATLLKGPVAGATTISGSGAVTADSFTANAKASLSSAGVISGSTLTLLDALTINSTKASISSAGHLSGTTAYLGSNAFIFGLLGVTGSLKLGSGTASGSAAGPGSFLAVTTTGQVVLAPALVTSSGGGGGGISQANQGDNRVVTSVDADNVNAEANLTFDGSTLKTTGVMSGSSDVTIAGGVYISGSAANDGLHVYRGIRVGGVASGGVTTAGVISGSAVSTIHGVTTDALIAQTADINGGSVDGATIGAASQSSVKATTLSGSSAMTIAGMSIFGPANYASISAAGVISGSGIATIHGVTTDALIAQTVDINGGSVDGATVGAASQSSVKATTLSGSSALTVAGASVFGPANYASISAAGVISGSVAATLYGLSTYALTAAGSTTLGRAVTDNHQLTGSLLTSGSITIAGSGSAYGLGIGTGSANTAFSVVNDYHTTRFFQQLATGSGGGEILKHSPGANDTLVSGRIYFLHTDGTWDEAIGRWSTSGSHGASQMLGVGLGGASQTTGVLLKGFIHVPSAEILNKPVACDGLPLYVATASSGHFDFTAPTGTNDFVRVVGYAVDDDASNVLVYFDPDKTWVVKA